MYKNIRHFNLFVGLVISLFFFPSITFGTIEAEVFPWGIMLSGLILYKQKKINAYFVLFLTALLLNIVLFSIINITDLRIPEVIRSCLAYLNSAICFVAFYQASENSILKTIRLVKSIFIFLLVLGILQAYGFIGFLDPIFKFLIPRASSESLAHVWRGVTLLSTEPARAGVSLTFLYIVVRTVYIKKRKILIDFLFLVYMLIILKSIMALSIYIIYLVFVYRFRLVKVIIAGAVFLLFMDTYSGSGRAFQMVKKLQKQESFEDAQMVVIDLAGPRIISIYSSWLYSSDNVLGGGIGRWRTTSVEALKMTKMDFSKINYFKFKGDSKPIPIRSSGYVSNLVLDTGYFGVFIFLIFVLSILKRFWRVDDDSKNIILIFLFKILFIGSVGPPVAWIAAIITLKYISYKKNYLLNSTS
ncbi:MAG: hypothetical protein AAF617_10730 [Bacteroidota bacterium]